MTDHISPILHRLHAEAPLVHAITNPISITQCANAVLALGARPIMAEHPREAAQITRTAAALLLNLGNITDVRMEAMALSARAAREQKIPAVLDAVGVACSDLRREYALSLLKHTPPAVIKGNYPEIRALVCPDYTASGVDGDARLTLEAAAVAAAELARRYGAVVLASGKADIVTNGSRTVLVHNGTPQLGQITGTGCMLGAVCACCLAAAPAFEAAVSACVLLGVAGERAATPQGSGTFFVRLMDELSTLDGRTVFSSQHTEEYHLENA